MLGAVTLVMLSALLAAQSPHVPTMAERLTREADRFAKLAPGLQARETLRQTVYESRGKGKEPKKKIREIQSIYTLLQTADGIREIRQPVAVDAKPVRQPNGGDLGALAMGITATSETERKRLLEQFERYGLKGIATDFGQIVLLFASGSNERFEFSYTRSDQMEEERVQIFRFQQIDGAESLTIYEGGKATRQKLNGEVWVRTRDQMPVRIMLASAREERSRKVQDVGTVDYRASGFGTLLPARVLRQQYVDNVLYVEDQFEYSPFRRGGAVPAP